MAPKSDVDAHVEDSHSASDYKHHDSPGAHIVPIQQEATEDVVAIKLSWRSWMVVFVTCFAYALKYNHSASSVNIGSAFYLRSSSL